ncbi:MAG: hypothetical protein HOH74_01415, partial [Gemmatimonadetes bacterium]|nr:hypothetical protein [Gemmatimonadota bacterium]
MTLLEALNSCARITLQTDHRVCQTVATALVEEGLTPDAATDQASDAPALRVGVDLEVPDEAGSDPWGWVQYADGVGVITASTPSLLYSLYTQIRDVWASEDADTFAQGRWLRPTFTWLAGRDELLTGRYGFLRNRQHPVGPEDIDASMRELARLGCNHVVINELARRSFETGPPGEVYYRFYDYTPDIDQYVETRLNAGTYPREYLQANLDLLRQIAEAADRYGLVPGLYSAHPRSVPESLLAKWP